MNANRTKEQTEQAIIKQIKKEFERIDKAVL